MATNEAEILRQLGIGIEKSKDPVGDSVSVVLTSFVKSKLEIVREILLNKGTGALGQSVVPMPIKEEGDLFLIEVQADEYAPFVDEGVNGVLQGYGSPYSFKNIFPSREMIDGLKSWNMTTGRTVPNAAYPNIKTYDQLAFATAVNVKKHGIEPTHFTEKAFGEASEKELAALLERVLAKVVEVRLVGATKPNGK